MDLGALTDPQNLMAAFVAIVTFATIVTLTGPLMRRNGLEARLKSVSTRREELRRKSREALAAARGGSLRHTDEGLYKRVVERLQLSRLLRRGELELAQVEKLRSVRLAPGHRVPRHHCAVAANAGCCNTHCCRVWSAATRARESARGQSATQGGGPRAQQTPGRFFPRS